MKTYWISFLGVLSILAPGAAWGQRPAAMTGRADVPPQIIAYQADLIVVAKLMRTHVPEPLRLEIPGDISRTTSLYQAFTFEVQKVIKEGHGTAEAEGIKSAATRAAAAQEEAKRRIDVYVRLLEGVNYPLAGVIPLEPGRTYILVLYRIQLKDTYFLPDNPLNRYLPTEQNVQVLEKASDPETWSWGPQAGGLKMAFLAPSRVVLPRKESLYIRGAIAIRNTSKNPILVNLDPADKPLSVTAAADGQGLRDDFYERPRKLRPGQSPLVGVPPGRIVFVDPAGMGEYGVSVHLPLTVGKWRLTAHCKSKRQIAAKESVAAWQGSISSAPVEVEVTPADHAATSPATDLPDTGLPMAHE